ncbi:GRB2-associated-binding protein 1-like isoform X2 [Mizuhopecten yessoensis]|uniref:GRB2-associated-binding protein 1-like isoform X2 n=1 Tax=Mizuhopecten yessoensis TaxID=6573 RepID=UPI000B45F288|nr:GRB2-associated-binding protein 1-like isoform X2 [Mizuhopecten yessoensis]
MNKISNVVYSGWMVKSPPEKKFRLTGPWKIFRAFTKDDTDTSKWKRRFFVLFKPASSLPHQYLLNYYTDENCKKLKGCIDLEHCEQVIESLDLDIFPFLLALKTFHKGRERTYFLSTDTEDEMTTWVRNLCSVCGLKPEESPDLPPEKPDSPRNHDNSNTTAAPVAVVPPRPQRSQTVMSQPQQDVRMRGRSIGRTNSKSGSHYIPLSDCLSEKSRRSSIPDELAPPPPLKTPKAPAPLPEGDDSVFQQTYDSPKQRSGEDDTDSVYKVPPPRREEGSTLEVYDIPPPARQSPSTPRSSSSESQKDSAYSSQSALTGLTYDYPPTHPDRGPTSDEVYDFPPPNPQMIQSQSDVPPPRPPKTSALSQEPYQNLPSNSAVVKEHKQISMDLNVVVPPTTSDGAPAGQSYDVPRPQNTLRKLSLYDMPKPQQNGGPKKDSNLLAIPPPPQSCAGPSSHSYINAARGYLPTPKDKVEDAYLPMERAFPPSDSLDKSAYSDMSRIPTSPVNYTDMSSDYDTPPKPGLPPRLSPRNNNDLGHEGMTRTEGDTYTIFSNARTRSFKRNNCIDHSGRVAAPTTLRVQLPYMSNNRHPDFSTSSEEEDEPVLGDPSQVMMPYSVLTGQGGHSSNLWGSTPPAPKRPEAELKYLDLALDDTSDKEAMRSPHSHTGHSTPTEYREIDFVKTQALSDVKKTVDNQRKHDDQ